MAEKTKTGKQILEILESRPRERRRLIPVLQDIQEHFGYLPREAMLEVASFLSIPESEVYSVGTFYNQFRFIPPGRHRIKVCLGTACQIKGGKVILDSWKRELSLNEGETSADREYSLERVACVGCCAMAPVTVVNEHIEGKVSPTRVKGILLTFNLERQKTHGDASKKSGGDPD
ncbi:MAG: NADH dehydrogenase [Chloroflexi bacterium RBG_13_54_9]|nr:MAG: NADH dehydrogenase [Chloroflexi bacterium RBG_13_54_9]